MKTELKTLRTTLGTLALGALLIAPTAQAEWNLNNLDIDNSQAGHFAPSNTTFESAGLELLSTGLINSQIGHFAARAPGSSTTLNRAFDGISVDTNR